MNSSIQEVKDNQLSYETLEKVIIDGDLSKLSPQERVSYYNKTCETLGLNPLTKPFDYIKLNNKLTLYARKDATEQLRKINKVSITKLENQLIGDVYIVTAYASSGDGRTDVATGAVSIKGLSGDVLANAYLKAETKSKRRVTLSICGLGLLDESEVESIPNAKHEKIVDVSDLRSQEEILNDMINEIKDSNSLDELKTKFISAYRTFKDDKDALYIIATEKDKRKDQLDYLDKE